MISYLPENEIIFYLASNIKNFLNGIIPGSITPIKIHATYDCKSNDVIL